MNISETTRNSFNSYEEINEIPDDDDKPFNIFEYIGRPTAEREVRRKQDLKTMKRMGKMDALKMLMMIAGDSWETDLVMGSQEEVEGGHSGMIIMC